MEFADINSALDLTPEICKDLADKVNARGSDGDIDVAIVEYLEEKEN